MGKSIAGSDSTEIWRPDVLTMSNVEALPVDWLVNGYIPRGAITIIEGDPGVGKSHVAYALAGSVTRGRPMPFVADNSSDWGRPRGVLYINGEEDPARVSRPHLEAAGADLTKAHFLRGMKSGEDVRALSLPRDMASLTELVRDQDLGLIVIDTLACFVDGDTNMNGEADVRRLLSQLALLAEREDLAVVIIRHLNKKQGISSMYRGGGSIGLTAAARAVFAIGRDREVEGGSVIACVKNNFGPTPDSVRFQIVGEGMKSSVKWGGKCDVTADELQEFTVSKAPRKIDRAKELILEMIDKGSKPVNDLIERCAAEGISVKTYHRAVEELDLKPQKDGFSGGWTLGLNPTSE